MLEVVIMAPARDRRDWLQRHLQARQSIRVAAAASTFPMLRSMVHEVSADVLVIELEPASDLEAVRDWLSEVLELSPIVLLTQTPVEALFKSLIRAGSGAILHTNSSAEQIVHAIETASAGLLTFDSSLIPGTAITIRLSEELTPRETEVLRLLAEGFANREIAIRLEISEHTIKFHIRSILGKLGAATRAEAVTRGFRAGLIDL
jgi:two-component system, NarL family, response regulator YdfI